MFVVLRYKEKKAIFYFWSIEVSEAIVKKAQDLILTDHGMKMRVTAKTVSWSYETAINSRHDK